MLHVTLLQVTTQRNPCNIVTNNFDKSNNLINLRTDSVTYGQSKAIEAIKVIWSFFGNDGMVMFLSWEQSASIVFR